jgi:glycosyltransferase involved in cell wall biosynthesis
MRYNELHVVLLSHEYPPFIYGGVGIFVENLAHGLLRRGVEVTVIAGYPVPSGGFKKFKADEEQTDSGINVVRFPYPNISPRQLWFQIFNLPKFSGVIRRINADVIHGQSGGAFPAMLTLQRFAPTLVTFHMGLKTMRNLTIHSLTRGGNFSDFFTYVVGYPVSLYSFREEFVRSDSAIAVSQTLMNEMKQDFGKKEKGELHYIHNGVDVEGLQAKQSSISGINDREKPTIVFGGRLYWTKGIVELLELAYLLRKNRNFDWKIKIYGTGPLSTMIKKRTLNLGLDNVVMFGHVGQLEFFEAVRKSTFVVIPSFNEACPLTLLECMCLGKIPCMFNLPYAREFTENGKYGILANNVDDMATQIESTYRDADLESMGKEIKRFATKKYDILKVASEYLKIYEELAN